MPNLKLWVLIFLQPDLAYGIEVLVQILRSFVKGSAPRDLQIEMGRDLEDAMNRSTSVSLRQAGFAEAITEDLGAIRRLGPTAGTEKCLQVEIRKPLAELFVDRGRVRTTFRVSEAREQYDISRRRRG